jgi:hypothetical protein
LLLLLLGSLFSRTLAISVAHFYSADYQDRNIS